ncbi:hypothetical protein FA454_14355 [Pseudomonas aeruginosa]|uniref:DUF6710 family protein n=1 Tax=Pseudomonas aeruginosa TaxID=287 RepID=UPI00071B34E8|nr:DUF6710 family protein [Pseudomonas aeruginosa]KSQ24954.2 hypothetical protein APB28_00295 [Pseudomonas aeruginosa]MCO1686917.1 hypothetical protein [Pseudomonas aeruginosa]MCO1780332.1 hypothetical protein [Pseudomonas aeruginosa]MCO1790182.1 hypothetical protein [Pseudomonas aeruginosa]MCO1799178.1 hypothetical protein [Pseudomonas aeruginosa]
MVDGETTRKPSWLGRVFRQRLAEEAAIRRERFEQVMALARKVAADDPLGLPSTARLVAAPLQARAMTSAAFRCAHGARGAYDLADFFGSPFARVTAAGETVGDLVDRSAPERYRLRLGRDPVLAVPWTRSRLVNALANIGHARRMGDWSADINHRVELLLPFGLALVHGGNHSLAAGIANAEGTVVTEAVTDLSPLYAHLRYNGLSMVRQHDGRTLWEVADDGLGVLFEIGRLMLEHGVRYDARVVDDTEIEDDKGEGFPICYRVFFDGADTGYSLSSSGATRMLLRAGITSGSAEARAVVVEGAEFVHRNRVGQSVRVMLEHYGRRPLVDDLERVTPHCLGGDD